VTIKGSPIPFSKKVAITILVDNKAGTGLLSEHGFSLWIERENERILFDTGQGRALFHNAKVLGIPLLSADTLVLSHGHYDHTGSIDTILSTSSHMKVYCHPSAFQKRYVIRKGIAREIGIPKSSLAQLKNLPQSRLFLSSEPTLLGKGIGLTGFVPRKSSFEDTGGPFYLDDRGETEDLLEDDNSLWIEREEGLVVCVGCSHAGIVNILRYIQDINAKSSILAVIGGFHLVEADKRRMEETILALRALSSNTLVICHCTGEHAMKKLHTELPNVEIGRVGAQYFF